MSTVVYLSHVLSPSTPGYGGKPGFFQKSISRISDGHTANSSEWEFFNHIGTHIDAPYHFVEEGRKLDDYPADFWIYNDAHLLCVNADPGMLLTPQHFQGIPQSTDLLLVKTGFEKFRSQELYWKNNPGVHPDVGYFLRSEFPLLRILGFDFISLTAYQNRPLGKAAHLAFLGALPNDSPPILLLEDLSLNTLHVSPKHVWITPLRVKNSDGGPVTVIAQL